MKIANFILHYLGRATDNICIERFWRSIKYEEIYLGGYKNMINNLGFKGEKLLQMEA